MANTITTISHTVPELAKRWRINPSKIRKWIAAGTLRAVDTCAAPGRMPPRWVVTAEAVERFELVRAGGTVPPRTRRSPKADGVIEFF